MAKPPVQRARVSYQDLCDAAVLPPEYLLPPQVQQLPMVDYSHLLSSPLVAVPRTRTPLYEAQRIMLHGWARQGTDEYLRTYCSVMIHLNPKAWDYVVHHGLPDYRYVTSAVSQKVISTVDAIAIVKLYQYWCELQQYSTVPQPSAAQPIFKSVRAPSVAAATLETTTRANVRS